MATFLYRAKKETGEVLEGSITADSERTAIKKLTESRCYPIWIKEEAPFTKAEEARTIFFLKQVKIRDLADFTRQCSDLLDSGLVLFDALNIIEDQTGHSKLKEIINGIKNSIKQGKTFSESLEAYPHIFSNLYINLVRSGETAGMLNEVLDNIADFLEKQEDIRSRIMLALAYPLLMLAVGVATVFILVGFVIPRLANMFIEMGEVLPLPTRILMGLSGFIRGYWILFAIAAAALAIFIRKTKSNRVTKKTIDGLKLKLPVVGALMKNSAMARFSRTLSMLLGNGVPVLHSLKITADIVDNEIVKEEVERIYTDVKAGSSLASAIKKNPTFSPFVVNMAAIGEEGGILDRTLLKVARSYEVEIDRALKMLASLLEPVMILIMGLVVGFIVVSMLLPVFQISLTAQ